MKIAAVLLLALALAGCSTTPVAVSYKADPGVAPFRHAAVGVGAFSDDRGESSKWLGAIRGGFGNPLKVLETDETAAGLVRRTFEEAVRARGGAGPPRKYEIRGSIKKLECSQYARREAHAIIEVSVIESASGRERFRATYSATNVEGSVMALDAGIFASVDDLRRVLERTLKETVDKALDDGRLRAAIA